MAIAVVASGWHYPLSFFTRMYQQNVSASLFVVGHRDPDLSIVRTEKLEALHRGTGRLADMDRELYQAYATKDCLKALDWDYVEAPNICGDWGNLNQWLETHDYRKYEAVLSIHDDTYIRTRHFLAQAVVKEWGEWLVLANCGCPTEPPGYLRGSCEFFSRELLEMLGGRIDLGDVKLTREGKTDSPKSIGELIPWNATGVPLREFLVKNGLAGRIARLSPYYRVSQFAVECERGFINSQQLGYPWTMDDGWRAFPV